MTYARNAALTIMTLAIASTAAALPASASSWAIWEGQNEAAPRVIYTDAVDEVGVLLACDAHGDMLAMLTLEPAALTDVMKRNAPYARGSDSKVIVGSDEPVEATFRYTPARKTLETNAHSVSAKIFNSAVKGEVLKIQTAREGVFETTLPAPNQSFKAFAKTCRDLRTPAAE